MAEVVLLLSFLSLSLLYLLPAVFLWFRKGRKQISSRSPVLLLISHVGNYCEQFCLLAEALDVVFTTHPAVLAALEVFFHFVYFFPYLLRGYRLYFVFHTDVEEKGDAQFLSHIKRSTQSWHLRMLLLLLLPVIILCSLILFLHLSQHESPTTSKNRLILESVVIADAFIEEMTLLIGMFCLRKVESEYAMTGELGIIAILWFFNSLFSLHSKYEFWVYELICRNALIMGISVLWPVVKSYHRPDPKDSLTLSTLYSLQMTLQNQVPFDHFERFLHGLQYSESATTLDTMAVRILHVYMSVEVYRSSRVVDGLKELVEEVMAVDREVDVLGKELGKTEVGSEEWVEFVEGNLFGLLRNYYFPRFVRSVEFRRLWKEVEQQELRVSKVKATSLCGTDLS